MLAVIPGSLVTVAREKEPRIRIELYSVMFTKYCALSRSKHENEDVVLISGWSHRAVCPSVLVAAEEGDYADEDRGQH